jgi:hypothetical protein
VFRAHFVLTRAHPGRTSQSVTHRSQPSTLNFGVFSDGPPEKKLQLVGMSILINLLSLGPGCHIHLPSEDRHPRRSTPSQERPLLATSVGPVPAHVPCCARTPPEIIPYYRLNYSIWSLSDNKESSRSELSGLHLVNHLKTQRESNECIKTPTKGSPECLTHKYQSPRRVQLLQTIIFDMEVNHLEFY